MEKDQKKPSDESNPKIDKNLSEDIEKNNDQSSPKEDDIDNKELDS